MTTGTEQAEKMLKSAGLQSGSQQQLTSHCAGSRSQTHRAATSVTGVGLGPERSGALGVPGVLGDREGCRVVGVALVELRSSFVTAGVAAAGMAMTWVLEEV